MYLERVDDDGYVLVVQRRPRSVRDTHCRHLELECMYLERVARLRLLLGARAVAFRVAADDVDLVLLLHRADVVARAAELEQRRAAPRAAAVTIVISIEWW